MDKSVFSNKPFLFILFTGFFEPSFNGLISETAAPQEQGRVQGASQSMQSITRIIGPLIAAGLYQFNHSLSWISCVIFSFLGIYLLYRHKDEIAKHLHAAGHK
jgi:DHA1 family tetracycline resistance protein-like MFS transporter